MDDGGGRVLLPEPWPEVTGRPGLTQGRYGEVGNLELVVPAVDDGLWVGWFNCDPVESHRGARSSAGVGRCGSRTRTRSGTSGGVDAQPRRQETSTLAGSLEPEDSRTDPAEEHRDR